MLAPLTQLDKEAITNAQDLPEPMFPDNYSSDNNRCMLDEQLQCVLFLFKGPVCTRLLLCDHFKEKENLRTVRAVFQVLQLCSQCARA
jgi:hypothetical protein